MGSPWWTLSLASPGRVSRAQPLCLLGSEPLRGYFIICRDLGGDTWEPPLAPQGQEPWVREPALGTLSERRQSPGERFHSLQ